MAKLQKTIQKRPGLRTTLRRSRYFLPIAILISGVVVAVPLASALTLQQRIDQLNDRNSDKYANVDDLEIKAANLQEKIRLLQRHINALQRSINANQDRIADLGKQIKQAQAELEEQKSLLGENIRTMYLEGQISTLEMLASSQDLSEFVDRQQYRNSVKSKIVATLDKITELKHELKKKKEQVQTRLANQKEMQNRVSAQRSERQQLLSANASERRTLNNEIKFNNARIAELRAEQVALNRSRGGIVVSGDPNRGGYPNYLNNAPKDALVDPWGMYNRECVSYTAWKVHQTFGFMPYWGGHGNANQWPANARAAGIPTGTTPRKNSVMVWNVGFYGHVMWVEDVYNNGTVRVSQYNYDWNGNYSEMVVSSGNATYIYFN